MNHVSAFRKRRTLLPFSNVIPHSHQRLNMSQRCLTKQVKNYFPAQQDLRLKIYSKHFLKMDITIQVGFSPVDSYDCLLVTRT